MPRSSNTRDRVKERVRQADNIKDKGHVVENPCEHCFLKGIPCIMDSKNRNCASCTRRGRKCEKRFHNDREWNELKRNEKQIQAQLAEALAEQAQISAKVARLFKQQQFLKDCGERMLDHDSNVLERLDEENPLSTEELQELERLADEQEAAQLAAVSNDPSLTQMMNSPSFWENFDSTVAGGIPSPTGDNPSSSR